MKVEHKGCGGAVVVDRIDKGTHTVTKGYKCSKCQAELHEGLTELFCHDKIVVTPENRFDELQIQGFKDMKKVYGAPTLPRRIRYPKKTAAYRKRKSRHE